MPSGSYTKHKKRHPSQINCRQGCARCCHNRLFVFPVEFDRLQAAFIKLPAGLKKLIQNDADWKWQHGICPLLVDGGRNLYEDRPIICRTHGYPLQSEFRVKTQSQVSVCHLNFINTRSFDDQDLIDIDGVGMILIGANREYIKTHPTSSTDAESRPIQDVVR